MTNFLDNILTEIFSLGLADKSNTDRLFKSVAAGDPTLGILSSGLDTLVDERLNEERRKGKEVFKVAGSSMSPEGISNGDFLVCKKTKYKSDNFKKGQYAIIAVDRDYYASKGKILKYDFKLRKTLFLVKADMTFESMISELEKTEDSLLLADNRKRLKDKYKDTKSYEMYKDIDMILSVTYRKGEIRYSFHPVNLIQYVAESVIKVEQGRIYENRL